MSVIVHRTQFFSLKHPKFVFRLSPLRRSNGLGGFERTGTSLLLYPDHKKLIYKKSPNIFAFLCESKSTATTTTLNLFRFTQNLYFKLEFIKNKSTFWDERFYNFKCFIKNKTARLRG